MCHFYSLEAGFFSILSGCQTVWIHIRPDILSGLIWVQTVCRSKLFAKVISRQQKLPLAGKDLNTKQLVDTTFWLDPWLKLILFGSYFFHLPKCWLQQILSQGKLVLKVLSSHGSKVEKLVNNNVTVSRLSLQIRRAWSLSWTY